MAWDTVPAPRYPTPDPYYLGNVLGNLVNNYQQAQQGQQRTRANELRNQQDQMLLGQERAFAGGVPMNPNGTPNYSQIMKTLAEKGDINAINSLAPIIQQQQNLEGANAPDQFLGGGYSSGGGGEGGTAKGTYSLSQMIQMAKDAGFQGQDAAHIAAIAMAESSGNPNATGKAGEVGLTQINPHAWSFADSARDPQQAFNDAFQVYKKQGWGAWSTDPTSKDFTPGNSMARFLPRAEADLGGGGGQQVASLGDSDATAYANPDQPAIPPVSAAAGSTIPRADGGGSTPKGAVGGGPAAAPPQQWAQNGPAWAGINAALPVGPAGATARPAQAAAAPAQGSVASIASALGIPAPVAVNVAKALHVDPRATLTPQQAQRAQRYAQNYVARTGQQKPNVGRGQPSAGEPIVPRYLQQMGLTDPQQAIQALDQDIARLSRFGAPAAGRIRVLEDIRNGIEKRAAPPKFGVIGRDQYDQPTYGWINPATQTVTPLAPQSQEQNVAPPGVSDVHGEAFLRTTDPNIANQVKALAEGRLQFPSGFALKSPYWQKMLQLVAQYDPSFDAVEYNARARARTDATSGKLAQNNNALNTGIGHVWQLAQAVDALHNGNIQSVNALRNWWSAEFGGTAPTNFDAIRDRVAPEITKIWRGAGGAESDIKRDISTLSSAKSPAQLYGALAEIAGLMESKIEANKAQYSNIMGPMAGKLQMITPKSQEILKHLESYSQPRQSGGGGAHPPGTYNYDPETGNLEPVK